MLESELSTGLRRNTVHHALNGEVLGVKVLTKIVPIKHNIRLPGGVYVCGVISFTDPITKSLPYDDLGLVEKCCTRVLAFNIQHYSNCYLNGGNTGPYTINYCRKCNVGIVDEKGHTISYIVRRKYRRDSYIFQTCETLQENESSERVFKYQERVITNGRDC